MPIISGGIFGFNDIKMGAALVNALVRKTNAMEWPKMWIICHPDARVLEAITTTVNQDQAAGEGRPDQGAAAGPAQSHIEILVTMTIRDISNYNCTSKKSN